MLMDRAGIEYHTASPRCDEQIPAETHPRDATLLLAERKARSIAAHHPDSLVIGSDQMAVLDGRILGKPGTEQGAVSQLMQLAGRTHDLWTATVVLDTRPRGLLRTHVELWEMTLRDLDRDQALRYVREDEPLDCAGSYRFESRGIRLFARVHGADPTAISGLPMIALLRMLNESGVSIV
jgi:septum formation protein